jgi:hypothetical protein
MTMASLSTVDIPAADEVVFGNDTSTVIVARPGECEHIIISRDAIIASFVNEADTDIAIHISPSRQEKLLRIVLVHNPRWLVCPRDVSRCTCRVHRLCHGHGVTRLAMRIALRPTMVASVAFGYEAGYRIQYQD